MFVFLLYKCFVVFEDFFLGSFWLSNFIVKKGYLCDVKVFSLSLLKFIGEKERENKVVKEMVWWLKFDCWGVLEEMKGVM